jgi:hypothetical protein
MRSMLSVVSVVFVGLIGCRTGEAQMASRTVLASNASSDDPNQICPDICGTGTLCRMPDGSCGEVCNACYCEREGGTVVEACPKADIAPQEFQATGVDRVAVGDADRAR